MKITFTPKTHLGKWTVGLIIAFFIFLAVFFMFMNLGERGEATFCSNLKLCLPMVTAALCGVLSFFTGIVSVIKKKERSVLVYLSTLLGGFILFWVSAEIMFPH